MKLISPEIVNLPATTAVDGAYENYYTALNPYAEVGVLAARHALRSFRELPDITESHVEERAEQHLYELEPAYEQLANHIKPELLEGRWAGVIADDRSGRLPAMVMRGIISRVDQMEGRTPATLTFLMPHTNPVAHARNQVLQKSFRTGEYERYMKELDPSLTFNWDARLRHSDSYPPTKNAENGVKKLYDSYLQPLRDRDPDGRQLVVTEVVEFGTKLTAIIEDLTRSGIAFDILTMAGRNQALEELLLKMPPGSRIYNAHLDDVARFVDSVEFAGNSGDDEAMGQHDDKDEFSPDSWPQRNGQPLPIGNWKQGSAMYAGYRAMSKLVAQRVFDRVFQERD